MLVEGRRSSTTPPTLLVRQLQTRRPLSPRPCKTAFRTGSDPGRVPTISAAFEAINATSRMSCGTPSSPGSTNGPPRPAAWQAIRSTSPIRRPTVRQPCRAGRQLDDVEQSPSFGREQVSRQRWNSPTARSRRETVRSRWVGTPAPRVVRSRRAMARSAGTAQPMAGVCQTHPEYPCDVGRIHDQRAIDLLAFVQLHCRAWHAGPPSAGACDGTGHLDRHRASADGSHRCLFRSAWRRCCRLAGSSAATDGP